MGKAAVYQRHRVTEAGRRQIEGFQRNSIQQMYRAQLRREAQSLGYHARAVTLTDKQALDAIKAEARTIAGGIQRGYNAKIQAALKALPDDLTDAQYTHHLRSVLADIHRYNQRFLIPRIADRARQMGRLDFHTRNNIKSLMQVEPTSSAGVDDGCDDAIALGQVDPDTASGYLLPLHPHCPHTWEISSVDATSLPDAESLWLGEAA